MKKLLLIIGCLIIVGAITLVCINIKPDGQSLDIVLGEAVDGAVDDVMDALDTAKIAVRHGASDVTDCVSGWFLDISYFLHHASNKLAY